MAGGISPCCQLEQDTSCWYAEDVTSIYNIWFDSVFRYIFFGRFKRPFNLTLPCRVTSCLLFMGIVIWHKIFPYLKTWNKEIPMGSAWHLKHPHISIIVICLVVHLLYYILRPHLIQTESTQDLT